MLKELWQNLLDLIFPRHCVCCGKSNPCDGYGHLCAKCRNAPFSKQVNRCKKCAEIVAGDVPLQTCAKCDTLDFSFDSAKVACEYADAGRILILELKYQRASFLAKDIAKIISESEGFVEYFKDSVLVPVPLHPKKYRKRGYNQSEEICKAILKQNPNLNISLSKMLRRKKATPTQTALTRDAREKNVRGAFELRKTSLPRNSKIIILDDVMTSGATLNECAKVLKKSKFTSVGVFAFCRRS